MDSFCYLCFEFVSHTVLSIPSWERAVIYCVFCHFPIWCPGSGAVFLVSIPDLCILLLVIQRVYLGLAARKPVFGGLPTTQVQTSLRIRAV